MSEATCVIDEVDCSTVRRYALYILRLAESNSMIPENDGVYSLKITNDGVDKVICTTSDSQSTVAFKTMPLTEFENIGIPIRDFDEITLKCTRDKTGEQPLEGNTVTLKFSNKTIRLSV